jgi:hypothetical protein
VNFKRPGDRQMRERVPLALGRVLGRYEWHICMVSFEVRAAA